jgi:molybdate transport system ATP-binding protein
MSLRIDDLLLPLAHFDLTVTVEMNARVTAIFGPSGAGKTSLLESIAGLRTLQRGRITLDDIVLSDLPARARRIGYVPQENLLFPHMSVERNIRYGVGQAILPVQPGMNDGEAGLPVLQHVIDVLEIQHLLNRNVKQLSGGEQKRVALARALVSSPRLLLLDEPLAAIDRPLRERIIEFLLRIRDDFRLPMLYVTHDENELAAVAEEVVRLERGRVVT